MISSIRRRGAPFTCQDHTQSSSCCPYTCPGQPRHQSQPHGSITSPPKHQWEGAGPVSTISQSERCTLEMWLSWVRGQIQPWKPIQKARQTSSSLSPEHSSQRQGFSPLLGAGLWVWQQVATKPLAKRQVLPVSSAYLCPPFTSPLPPRSKCREEQQWSTEPPVGTLL